MPVVVGNKPVAHARVAHHYSLHDISKLSSATANKFWGVAQAISKANPEWTGLNAVRISGDPSKAGESVTARSIRVLERSLHHDYPITGDDGGYSFTKLPASTTLKDISAALADTAFADNDALANSILASVKKGLSVMVGTGSGNNTYANIVGVMDTRKHEFAYVVDSNFGSDD